MILKQEATSLTIYKTIVPLNIILIHILKETTIIFIFKKCTSINCHLNFKHVTKHLEFWLRNPESFYFFFTILMCRDGELVVECDAEFSNSNTVCGIRIPDQ